MGGFGSGRGWGKATTGQCLNLDVRMLNKKGLLKENVRRFGWSWTMDGQQNAAIEIEVDAGHSIRLIYSYHGERKDYWVPLTYTPCNYGNERVWFLCPNWSCQKRIAKLYLKGGYFYCRTCQNLTYRSCQESGDTTSETISRIMRVQKKLKMDNATPMDKPLFKPKGMHQKTFDRLKRELEIAQWQNMRAFIDGAKRICNL